MDSWDTVKYLGSGTINSFVTSDRSSKSTVPSYVKNIKPATYPHYFLPSNHIHQCISAPLHFLERWHAVTKTTTMFCPVLLVQFPASHRIRTHYCLQYKIYVVKSVLDQQVVSVNMSWWSFKSVLWSDRILNPSVNRVSVTNLPLKGTKKYKRRLTYGTVYPIQR